MNTIFFKLNCWNESFIICSILSCFWWSIFRRYDTQHINIQYNDIQQNDIQHNEIQHNDIQHNDTQHSDTQHNDIQHNDIQHNDSQHNDIQHNDIKYNDIQHNDTQHKGFFATVSINGTQYNNTMCVVALYWLSLRKVRRFIYCYAESFYTLCLIL